MQRADTAASLNSMALVLEDQGELASGRRLHERALDIRERVVGPTTATQLPAPCSSARVSWAPHGPFRARPGYLSAGAGGPTTPNSAASLDNLAVLLRAQGQLTAARPMFERPARHLRAGHLGRLPRISQSVISTAFEFLTLGHPEVLPAAPQAAA